MGRGHRRADRGHCAAGFDALGIIVERAGADAAASDRAAGLGCHEVLLALLLGDDESDALGAAERLADAAAAMGATWVLTAFLAPLSPRTQTIIERCASTFSAAGQGMAVEFSPLGPVSTIPQALDIVRVANRGGGRAGLLIDSWHFCVGGAPGRTWRRSRSTRSPDAAFPADALAPESDSLRRGDVAPACAPGRGRARAREVRLDAARSWVEGTVSAEALSSELRTLPITDIVRRIHDTIAPYGR